MIENYRICIREVDNMKLLSVAVENQGLRIWQMMQDRLCLELSLLQRDEADDMEKLLKAVCC